MNEIRALWQRIRVLFTFARLLRVDDSGALQVAQLEGLVGEIREDVPRIGEWGLASNPPPNSQAVVIALGADRGQLVIVGVEDRNTRPTGLVTGAVRLYSIGGNHVELLPDGSIAIVGPVGSISVDPAGAVAVNGTTIDLDATGAVTITAAGAVNLTAGGAVSLSATGAVSIAGSAVTLGPGSTIDGKNFLAHTHNVIAVGAPSGAVN